MACNLKFNGINGEFSLDKFKGKKIVLDILVKLI